MFRKFEKRQEKSLSKRVRLSPKAVHYRLALERAEFNPERIELDEYYSGLKDVQGSRDKAWLWNALALGALFLFHFGALEDFSFFGVSSDTTVLGYMVFILYALSAMFVSSYQAKIIRYQSVFDAAHAHGCGADKQHLILRYPRAYSPLLFANWMSGGPRFMYPVNGPPIRIVILLCAMIPALLGLVLFNLWLLGSVTYQLWETNGSVIGPWARMAVVSCWIVLIGTLFLPTIAFRRIEFDHYGLTEMLEVIRAKDPQRYRRFINLIDNIEQRQNALRANLAPTDRASSSD